MTIAALFGAFPLLGVVLGLAGARFPRLPLIAAGLVLGAFLISLGALGTWAGTCWDCRIGWGGTRSDFFIVLELTVGLLVGTMLMGIWLGARLVKTLRRLHRTWRELRGMPEENTDAVR